jgi:glycerol uptake facilitator-like aquaporin
MRAILYDRRNYHDAAWRIILPFNRYRNLCRPIALESLWLFWVAPIVGGVIGGGIARWLEGPSSTN